MTRQAIREISVKQLWHSVHSLPSYQHLRVRLSALMSPTSMNLFGYSRRIEIDTPSEALVPQATAYMVEIQVVISRFTMAHSLLVKQCRRCGGPAE
jgi:hypothetical protein